MRSSTYYTGKREFLQPKANIPYAHSGEHSEKRKNATRGTAKENGGKALCCREKSEQRARFSAEICRFSVIYTDLMCAGLEKNSGSYYNKGYYKSGCGGAEITEGRAEAWNESSEMRDSAR